MRWPEANLRRGQGYGRRIGGRPREGPSEETVLERAGPAGVSRRGGTEAGGRGSKEKPLPKLRDPLARWSLTWVFGGIVMGHFTTGSLEGER